MKYYEVDFHIHIKTLNEPEGCGPDCGMLLQDVRDIIAANAGETGFETFEDTDDGIKGYVRTDMFDAGAWHNPWKTCRSGTFPSLMT